MTPVVTRTQQRLITWGGLGLAALALVLGALYQADSPTPDNNVARDVANAGLSTTVPGQTTTTAPGSDPVEAFLPLSGEASACREAVGVDLRPGYAAILTINGIPIPPDEMNVTVDENGQAVPGDRSASRALGQYTFGPEPECPNGQVLRPTGNLLRACVYRVEDGPATCVPKETTFDVL